MAAPAFKVLPGLPTVSGFYWMIDYEAGEHSMVHVNEEQPGSGYWRVSRFGAERAHSINASNFRNMRWAGPVRADVLGCRHNGKMQPAITPEPRCLIALTRRPTSKGESCE